MAGNDWMIYGANGYTGGVCLDHALSLGLRPVLAGRREEAIRPLAERHGLSYRVFGLDEPRAAARMLEGIGTLLLVAGPFSATSTPAIDACMIARTHYVDITGEVAVFEAARARDAEAKSHGVVLLPGAGFDVVPSDCLAMALHRALPGASRLSLAICIVGSPGPGSIKTAVEGAAEGGWIRRDGTLTQVPGAWRTAKIPFDHGDRWAMTIPWGDLSTAYGSTGIPNIEVYMATPRLAIQLVRWTRPFMGLLRQASLQHVVKGIVGRLVSGGNQAVREAGRSWVWGRAEDDAGRHVEGIVESLETTTLTAHTSVDIAMKLRAGDVSPGVTTPSVAFGMNYIRTFPGTTMSISALTS